MNLIVIEKSGRQRKGVEKECPSCRRTFVTRADAPHTYCSVECSAIGQEGKPKVQLSCATCDRLFIRRLKKVSKSGFYFCCRACKDSAQRIGGKILPPHYGTSKEEYRRLFRDEEFVCARCGYSEFKLAVQIHHRDGDHDNNERENLIPLCSNCHQTLHFGCWSF